MWFCLTAGSPQDSLSPVRSWLLTNLPRHLYRLLSARVTVNPREINLGRFSAFTVYINFATPFFYYAIGVLRELLCVCNLQCLALHDRLIMRPCLYLPTVNVFTCLMLVVVLDYCNTHLFSPTIDLSSNRRRFNVCTSKVIIYMPNVGFL